MDINRFFLFLLVLLLKVFWLVTSCNEAVCGGIVTKCLLLKSCMCDVKRFSCAKSCRHCIGKYHKECCNCVGLCPETVPHRNTMNLLPTVETFSDATPELFYALIQYPDSRKRWLTHQLPPGGNERNMLTNERCTLASIKNCLPHKECVNICRSMGSSSSRWFPNGCCECIGPNCKNRELGFGRCQKCSKYHYPNLQEQG